MDIYIVSLSISVITVLLIPISVFWFKNWIASRIQYSIKHGFDKRLSEIEHNRVVRVKAELVAELLSEWINKNDDKQKLNELTFKAFLWLPPEIASELSAILNHDETAPNVRAIIDKVRKHLLGDNDSLKEHQVIVFPINK